MQAMFTALASESHLKISINGRDSLSPSRQTPKYLFFESRCVNSFLMTGCKRHLWRRGVWLRENNANSQSLSAACLTCHPLSKGTQVLRKYARVSAEWLVRTEALRSARSERLQRKCLQILHGSRRGEAEKERRGKCMNGSSANVRGKERQALRDRRKATVFLQQGEDTWLGA